MIGYTVRSDRFRSGLPVSTFVGINYLTKYRHSSKGQSSKITLTYELEVAFYICQI